MHPSQHASTMFGVPSQSFPTTNVTTEQIQKYLDENKRLILAILENQNLGKLSECAQYQAQLQKNLMYLAAIADAQSQTPGASASTQMTLQPTMSQGHFVQHSQLSGSQPQQQPQQQPQAHSKPQGQPQLQPQTQSQSQQGAFPPHMLFPVGAYQPHDQQQISPYIQQQQAMIGSVGMRMGANNGIHPAMLSGLGGAATNQMDLRGRQDGLVEVGPGDGHGKPSGQGGTGGANRES